jgi:1-aminocyclopropane-1-carboxylate deaminase
MDNLLLDNLMMPPANYPSLVTPVNWPELTAGNIGLDVLRLDKLHPVISGNKWFKLNRHLQTALLSPGSPLLTFGGAWSNHLIATAYAAKLAHLSSIGIVRGERPATLSYTLEAAEACGMHLEFVSRETYAGKDRTAFLGQLADRYPGVYIIPEGGGGPAGIRGSEDILSGFETTAYTHILCAIGTGTTFLGLARAAAPGQQVIGVPVLKGLDQLDTTGLLTTEQGSRSRLLAGYHFGGYARHPQPLLDFMNLFYQQTGIPSDIVYTGKLFYAVRDCLSQHLFPPASRLLVIHSGGLQGNRSLPPGKLNF